MSTMTEAATITLVHSVAGLYAEIEDLPMQTGPTWSRQQRLVEAACAVLTERYPHLRAVGQSVESETRVHLWVERI